MSPLLCRTAALLSPGMLAVLLTACLSVDSIALRDEDDAAVADAGERGEPDSNHGAHPPPGADRDAAVVEASDASDSGSTAEPDTGTIEPPPPPGTRVGDPCVDRGDYAIDGITFRGMAETCNGDLVCAGGTCQELGDCTPGTTHECVFSTPPQRGKAAVAVDGEYVYWLEEGTYDALQNYQHDGAIARARIGEWTREELASGLELSELQESSLLYAHAGHLFFATFDDGYYFDVASQDPPMHVVADIGQNLFNRDFPPYCFKDDMVYWVDQPNIYRGRAGDAIDELVGTMPVGFPNVDCEVSDDHIVIANASFVYRLSLTSGGAAELLTDDGPVILIAASQDHAFTAHGEGNLQLWIRSIDLSADSPSYMNIGGGTNYAGYFGVADGFAYWTHPGDSREDSVIFRVPVDGSGPEQVVAEVLPSSARLDNPPVYWIGSAYYGSSGVLWRMLNQSSQTLHYTPFSP